MKYKSLLVLVACGCIFETNTAKTKTPLMGWSSWNTYRVNISDSLICSQADAMVKLGLKKAGYKYINIDDGFFGGRNEKGQLITHPTRFPRGLKPVAKHIHKLGLKAGIYSDAGRNTCGSFWDKDTLGQGVGMYGHDQEDADFYFKTCGFDFIKVDFCGGDATQNSEQLKLNEEERYRAIRQAILATGRKDVKLNICRWNFPGTWACEIADSWRISQDINKSWNSIKDIIEQNLYLSAYCAEGRFNDMDMLEVGRGLTDEEDKTHFGMWCMMSSPLLIGCDLHQLSEKTLALITNPELVAINQDKLALQARVIKAYKSGAYALAKDIKKANGTERVVAFYNPTEEEQTLHLSLEALELNGRTRVHDVFTHKRLTDVYDSLATTVPPHGLRIYRLRSRFRLMRRIYQAEDAWLQAYQEISPLSATPIIATETEASGMKIVKGLGQSKDNSLEWRDVYVKKEGSYRATLTCFAQEDCTAYIQVNGRIVRRIDITGAKGPILFEITLPLQAGYNTVGLSNAEGFMPDIDCLEIL